jgi:hypothetical protein
MPDVRTPRRMPLSEPVPRGWLPRDRVIGDTGIDKRTLNNWRVRYLIPRPVIVGNASYYRPETIEIVRRLLELCTESHNADDWLWRLWLEGHPVEMQGWVGERLGKLTMKLAVDWQSREVVEAVATELANQSSGRVRKTNEVTKDLADLLLSAARSDADINELTEGVFDALRKIGGLPLSAAFPLFDVDLFDLFSLDRQAKIIAKATDDEVEQARRDWQTITRLAAVVESVDWSAVVPIIEPAIASIIGAPPEPPSWRARKARRVRPPSKPATIGFLAARWRSFDFRAVALAFLIGARRPSKTDPDRSKRITEILALADWAMTLFQTPLPNELSASDRLNAAIASATL